MYISYYMYMQLVKRQNEQKAKSVLHNSAIRWSFSSQYNHKNLHLPYKMDCFGGIPEKNMVFSVMSLLLSYSQKPVKKSREELRREKQEEEKRLYEVSETSTVIQNFYKSFKPRSTLHQNWRQPKQGAV